MASAAYRAGEKLHSEYYGEDSDYTNKGGVIYTEIFLPPYAPKEYADREALWNAVEKVEKGKKAQLAYSFDISFQNEFSMEENPYLKHEPMSENQPRCNIRFDENGSIVVKNISAYWIPELTVTEKISGTIYTITGSYEGEDSFIRKLERIASRKFTNQLGGHQ